MMHSSFNFIHKHMHIHAGAHIRYVTTVCFMLLKIAVLGK